MYKQKEGALLLFRRTVYLPAYTCRDMIKSDLQRFSFQHEHFYYIIAPRQKQVPRLYIFMLSQFPPYVSSGLRALQTFKYVIK